MYEILADLETHKDLLALEKKCTFVLRKGLIYVVPAVLELTSLFLHLEC